MSQIIPSEWNSSTIVVFGEWKSKRKAKIDIQTDSSPEIFQLTSFGLRGAMKPCRRTSLLPVVGNLNIRLSQIHVKLYLLNLTMALKLIGVKPNSKSHQRVCLISRAHLSSFVRAEAPHHPRTLIWRPVGGIPTGWVMGWKHRDSALGDHKAEESRGGVGGGGATGSGTLLLK